MTLYNFLQLNHKQRFLAVLSKGEFLTGRSSGSYNIYLYAINNFFVEVWHRIDNNEVELVRPFKCTEFLQPYLDMLDLSELTSL